MGYILSDLSPISSDLLHYDRLSNCGNRFCLEENEIILLVLSKLRQYTKFTLIRTISNSAMIDDIIFGKNVMSNLSMKHDPCLRHIFNVLWNHVPIPFVTIKPNLPV